VIFFYALKKIQQNNISRRKSRTAKKGNICLQLCRGFGIMIGGKDCAERIFFK